jgi:hypothetical protein
VNRIKRPNTWLHRPMLQNVKKVLANPEPSTHDPLRTWTPRPALPVQLDFRSVPPPNPALGCQSDRGAYFGETD